MRFLFDQNLSRGLLGLLADLFPGSIHVREAGLQAADDEAVWALAVEQRLAIISKDSDFHQRSFLFGQPPKASGSGVATVRRVRSRLSSEHTITTCWHSTKMRQGSSSLWGRGTISTLPNNALQRTGGIALVYNVINIGERRLSPPLTTAH